MNRVLIVRIVERGCGNVMKITFVCRSHEWIEFLLYISPTEMFETDILYYTFEIFFVNQNFKKFNMDIFTDVKKKRIFACATQKKIVTAFQSTVLKWLMTCTIEMGRNGQK